MGITRRSHRRFTKWPAPCEFGGAHQPVVADTFNIRRRFDLYQRQGGNRETQTGIADCIADDVCVRQRVCRHGTGIGGAAAAAGGGQARKAGAKGGLDRRPLGLAKGTLRVGAGALGTQSQGHLGARTLGQAWPSLRLGEGSLAEINPAEQIKEIGARRPRPYPFPFSHTTYSVPAPVSG